MNQIRNRVSIVIPAYNEERYLPACLDAIAAQTIKPYEVIVVDNNSSDNTVKIAHAYPFVRVVSETRQGIVFARNAGFNAVTGDIIGRIDADTRLPSTWVAQLQTYFVKHPATAAVTGKGYFYDFGLRRTVSLLHTFTYYVTQGLISGMAILWGSNMALRREAWLAVADQCSTRTDIDEDIDLSLRLRRKHLVTAYESHLYAQMSLRRGNLAPGQIFSYLRSWPKNYLINNMPIRAVLISFVMAVAVVFAYIASPTARLISWLHPKK
jgi:glycosyltransferase involved in cell wall biosynthesis